jgi:NAD(P)-dependent dehydrogenase (short-subunit alcohol dehydrogenase family)
MNNIIFITGCNGSLASYLTNELSKKGFYLMGCDIDTNTSERTKNSMALGLKKYFQCDLSNVEQMDSLRILLEKLDNYPDILINNAAIDFVPTPNSDQRGLDFSDFDRIINVNVKAPLFLSKFFIF